MNWLKTHPFAVEAHFESSTVLTFAAPTAELQQMLPPCLEVDAYNDIWGFVAVAMVQTKDLRPKGFPKFLGNDFFLIGYRIFVRYTNNQGKRLRGLYILQSETDKIKMRLLGNLMTHYNYKKIDISRQFSAQENTISSVQTGLKVCYSTLEESIPLPKGTPFPDWKTARRFAGPLPFTFTYAPVENKVLWVEGVRQNWIPKPIAVSEYEIPFLDTLKLSSYTLANAFEIRDIPYWWKKGKTEIWQP